MRVKIPHVVRDKDRHDNIRLYFRRDGRKIRLRGPEGSPEFFEDYRRALAGLVVLPNRASTQTSSGRPVTMHELIQAYYRAAAFKTLNKRTQYVRRLILERFCKNNGDGEKPFASLEVANLRVRRDVMADRPEAANGLIKALRQVFAFAMKYELHSQNPAAQVEYLQSSADGIRAWMIEDVDQFKAAHPVGTMARLVLTLALHTGQRKSDLIRLGPRNIRTDNSGTWIHLVQQKNNERNPVRLDLPLQPELKRILEVTQTGDETFIITEFGKPFSEGGFGNRFRRWCDAAGLTGLSVHGLRKTASAFLAEAGCSELEIMAVTGHRTSKEVLRYTRTANQRLRAENAFAKTQLIQKEQ